MIFTDARTKQQIDKDINRMKLPKYIYNKLIWKKKQMSKFKAFLL
jgi:hypothetical protein